MKGHLKQAVALMLAGLAYAQPGVGASDIDQFVREPDIYSVQMSPDGEHLATVRNFEGRKILQLLETRGLKSVGEFGVAGDYDVGDVYWVSNTRLMLGWARRLGTNGKPEYTGDLMAVDLDGKNIESIFQGQPDSSMYGSSNYRDFDVVDGLPDDPDHALVSKYYRGESLPWLTRVNVKNGNFIKIAPSRENGGQFFTDYEGNVRMQSGTDRNARRVVYFRKEKGGGWDEIARASVDEGFIYPLEFREDATSVLFEGNVDEPTFGLLKVDTQSGSQELLYRNPRYDLENVIWDPKSGEPVAVTWIGQRFGWKILDGKHPDAAIWAGLINAFSEQDVIPVSSSRDHSKLVFKTVSDTAPTTYYVLDKAAKKIIAKLATRPWINPDQMSHTYPARFAARDGTTIDVYLTLPKGKPQKGNPLVVLPHGGPYNVRDDWSFSSEAQILAGHGYAVLTVNYRGSGGYGRDFKLAGYREWGGAMQNDLTDATHWAIEQGFAERSRICIFGGSYGAYAAMMGVIKEPDLYQCAIGYSGLYDLQYDWREIRARNSPATEAWFRSAVGDPDELAAIEPVSLANKITRPVFLIHGGEDKVTPIEQYRHMASALKGAGHNFESLVKSEEGHGFYDPKNQHEVYKRMLEFLDKNIGAK